MRNTSSLALLFFAACVVFLLPNLAAGQNGFLPVIAKSRFAVDQVDSISGKTTNHKLEYGRYYQSSDGSYLKQSFVPGSQDTLARGEIYDTKNDVLYELDYTTKQAVGRSIKSRKTPAPSNLVKDGGQPQVINGVECIPYPVWGKEEGQRVRVGTICQTPDGSVTMRFESSLNFGTLKGTMVSELYDVELGHEPDPALFRIPTDFTVSPPTEQKTPPTKQKAPCPTCPQ